MADKLDVVVGLIAKEFPEFEVEDRFVAGMHILWITDPDGSLSVEAWLHHDGAVQLFRKNAGGAVAGGTTPEDAMVGFRNLVDSDS